MRTGKLANIVFKICGIAVVLLSFAGGWLAMDYKHYVGNPLPVAEPGYHYVIAPGASLKHFTTDLHAAGILPHPAYFRWMARFAGDTQAIKAGEYLFEPGITPPQLLRQVVRRARRRRPARLHHRRRVDVRPTAGGLAPR